MMKTRPWFGRTSPFREIATGELKTNLEPNKKKAAATLSANTFLKRARVWFFTSSHVSRSTTRHDRQEFRRFITGFDFESAVIAAESTR